MHSATTDTRAFPGVTVTSYGRPAISRSVFHEVGRTVRSARLFVLVCVVSGLAVAAAAQVTNAPIDWDKARGLHQRYERGEHLTDDELAYLHMARSERARRLGEGEPPSLNVFTNSGRTLMRFVPLTDLKPGAKYKGEEGGLYGAGRNEPPPELVAAARKALAGVTPRDADGHPDPAGRVVLMSIGMSNTTQEFSAFKTLADADRVRSGALLIVDGAQGGRDALSWDLADPVALDVWREAERRVNAAGATFAQVQVVWLKQARRNPASLGAYPRHAAELKGHLVAILQEARRRCPNLSLAYLSSRTYGGYARGTLNPEPYAYESAFAVRALIRDQLRGDPRLNADPAAGPVLAPVVAWGPYLWTDGPAARADGLTWETSDVGRDGVHPSAAGCRKVADLLLEFFRINPLAAPWYTGRGLEPEADEPDGRAAPEQAGHGRDETPHVR